MALITNQHLHVIKSNIKRYGVHCYISRNGVNDFGEPTEPAIIQECKGLFHYGNEHLSVNLTDGGSVQTKKVPFVLLIHEKDLKLDDIVKINNHSYKITGINYIGNLGMIDDVSLGGDTDD